MSDPTPPAPSADTIETAHQWLGCSPGETYLRTGLRAECCRLHRKDAITALVTESVAWPCPVAVDLAAHIEDRDRARDADLAERLDRAAERLDTAAGERPRLRVRDAAFVGQGCWCPARGVVRAGPTSPGAPVTPEYSPGGHITGPPVIATMRVHHVDADGTRWYVDDHTSEPYRIINLDEVKRHGRIVIQRMTALLQEDQ